MVESIERWAQDIQFLCALPNAILVIIVVILGIFVYAQYKKINNMKNEHSQEIIGFKNSLQSKGATVLTTIFPYNNAKYLILELQIYSTQINSVSEAECSLILDSPIEIYLSNKINITHKTSANKYVYDLPDNLFEKSSCKNYKKLVLKLDKNKLKKNKTSDITLSFQHQNISYKYPLDI